MITAEHLNFLHHVPFLGSARISHSTVEAGSWQEIRIFYTVGSGGMADGAGIKIAFRFYSDWAHFQTTEVAHDHFVSATIRRREPFNGESTSTARLLQVSYDQKGHERPFQKILKIDVVDGFLHVGDQIEVVLGDRSGGGRGSRVQTFAEREFLFRVFVDTTGSSRFAELENPLSVAVHHGRISRVRILSPTVVRSAARVPITVAGYDAWGNPAPLPSEGHLLCNGQTIVPTASLGGPVWTRQTLPIDVPGDYLLTWSDSTLHCEPGFLSVCPDFPVERARFGDLHIHSHDTVGINPTEENMQYARDIAALDFAGYTANDFNITKENWDRAVAVCRDFDEVGSFVCFAGTEWCGSTSTGGDRNVIFLVGEPLFDRDSDGKSLRSFEWNENTKPGHKLRPGLLTASDLYRAYRAIEESVVMIPHVGGRRADLAWHDEALEPLVEIASSWGHFEWFYQDALRRGYRVGASAAGDEHRGRPGGGDPGVDYFGVRGGITGVLSTELSAGDVGRALKSRHTWATTGQRAVALLRAGEFWQGDVLPAPPDEPISYGIWSPIGLELIELVDQNGTVLLQRNLHREIGLSSNHMRIRWGGARVPDRYRWARWQGSIRIAGSPVLSHEVAGLDHPEETVEFDGSDRFTVRTDTYGDADALVLELEHLESAKISLDLTIQAYRKAGPQTPYARDAVTPGIKRTFDHSAVAKEDGVYLPLGGQNLFISIEPVTAQTLPMRVEGEFRLPVGTSAELVYLRARDLQQNWLWSSPLFWERKMRVEEGSGAIEVVRKRGVSGVNET